MSTNLNKRRVSAPPSCTTVGYTQFIVEYQVAPIDCEAEVEVIRINRVNALVLLQIIHAVISMHHSLDVSSTITIISDIGSHLSTIHSSAPCIPVCLTSAGNQISIAIVASTPSKIVGTDYCVLRKVGFVKNNHEVVPVSSARRIVGEVNNLCLLRLNLDIVRMHRPPARRIILSTQDMWIGNDNSLCECREFVYYIECLDSNDRLSGCLALEGLGVHCHKCLLSKFVDVRNSLKQQVISGNFLRDTLLEHHCSCHIGQSLLFCCSNKHF